MKNLLIISLSFITLMMSCKKSDDDKPSGGGGNTSTTCLISKITNSDGTTEEYFFNSSDQITKVINTDSSGAAERIYTRSGNVVTSTDDGGMITTYYLNASGLADSAVINFSVLGTIRMAIKYAGGFPEVQTVSGNFFGNEIYQVSYFDILNGNITKIRTVEDTTETINTFTYSDKPNKSKRFQELTDFMYSNSNLVLTSNNDGEVTNYSYQYDAEGKVTKVTTDTNGDVSNAIYQWTCK